MKIRCKTILRGAHNAILMIKVYQVYALRIIIPSVNHNFAFFQYYAQPNEEWN